MNISEVGAQAPAVAKISKAAIWSLILGCLFFVPLAGAVGLIVGIVALVNISRSERRLTGKGMAVSGLALGVITTVVWLCLGTFGFGVVSIAIKADEACRDNLVAIGGGIQAYVADNAGAPPSDLQGLYDDGYVANAGTFVCPAHAFGEAVRQGRQSGGSQNWDPESLEASISVSDIDGTGSYNYGRLKTIAGLEDASRVPLVWDKTPHWKGRVRVLWADFSESKIGKDELARILEEKAELYEEPPTPPGSGLLETIMEEPR